MASFDRNNPPSLELSFAATAASASVSVDIEKRMMAGVGLCAAGEAKGHGISIEQSFIEDLVKFAKKMPKGVKCNLRHNYENLGFQLGRIKSITLDGEKAVGDLHLYSSADSSPLAPGMATWTMNLAQEDPEALMMSIRAELAYYYQKDENGNEVKVWEYTSEGNWVSPNYEMPIYGKFAALRSCDVVAEGALTDAMFSRPTTQNEILFSKFLKKVEKFFSDDTTSPTNTNPTMIDEKDITASDAAVETPQSDTPETVAIAPTIDPAPEATHDVEETPAAVSEPTPDATPSVEAQIQNLTQQFSEFKTQNDALVSENADLKAQLNAANAQIATLKEQPAAEHASGETQTVTASKGFGKAHDALKLKYNLP